MQMRMFLFLLTVLEWILKAGNVMLIIIVSLYLLVETLKDNYGDKTAIKNAHCVPLLTMVKPQHNFRFAYLL